VWFRLLLIGILIYLIVNLVGRALGGGQKKSPEGSRSTEGNNKKGKKGVPDDVGEYVDYEEVDDD